MTKPKQSQPEPDSLFEFERSMNQNGFPLTAIEKSVQRALNELKDDLGEEFDAMKGAHAQIAMELANNIGAGNRKGRAIANEAMQLSATLELLKPVAPEEATARDLPEGVMLLVQAISQRPTVGGPSAVDL